MHTRLFIPLIACAAMCLCCSKPQSLTYGQGGNYGGKEEEKEEEKEDEDNTNPATDPTTPTTYTIERFDTIKVMTFNVLKSATTDTGVVRWSVRMPAIVKMIKELKPDVIGLQECFQAQYTGLLNSLPDYAGRNIPENMKNFGTAILFRTDRFKVNGSGYLWFSDSPTVPSVAWASICDDPCYRTYIWTDLQLLDRDCTIYFYTTHFPRNYTNDHPNNEARKKCAQAIVDHASSRVSSKDIVVVTGDMNCKISNETASLQPFFNWMNCSWQSLPSDAHDWYRGHNSYEEGCPKIGIEDSVDQIFFKNMEPVRYKTVWEPYNGVKYLSDHYPILFTAVVKYSEECSSQTSDDDLEGYENGQTADIW